ncbi:MAG TPA: tRNA (N(6)-L-threonylcarbamoyladenosine(37)-C(2))-methylthiotransferase MtaB [Bacteroidales bacterium]|nr:tRNA (N(6)-L-threonylcarbamoyladenosine(37)-C(2))-methylthiotransferase MtaB [Bacteroidales bacterium]
MNDEKIKVAFHTLGCKLNFTETSTIARSFPEDKFERVPAGKKADIYIINTCSVTDTADKKCKQAIRKFINQSPEAFIAVVGCYAQLNPSEIASIPGVDLVLGINEKFDVAQYFTGNKAIKQPEIHSCELTSSERFVHSYSSGDRTRSFLKVQDGCDYHCSYCTIPLARGASRNPSIETLLAETALIASKGVKEIVVTGVNIGDFGKSTGDDFKTLMKELIKTEGIERFRISSIEPNLLTDELLVMLAGESKILPHFHIPLQSGCNRILALMGRRYKRELFSERVNRIKELIPMAGIGADVIVGFPGETSADFDETYEFLRATPLSYLHVFSYSGRPNTKADQMPGKINSSTKEERSKLLISLSQSKHREFMNQNTGHEAFVLFEKSRTGGMITGYTGNYLRVEYPWDQKLAGQIKKVKLTGISDNERMSIQIIQ